MTTPIQQLLDIMSQLRNPQGGCPWDLEQDYQTMIPHLLEESYEVGDRDPPRTGEHPRP